VSSDVEAAFSEVERNASLAETASLELERAYHHLLASAEQRSASGVQAKNDFRRLVEV
jgi:hypothetical protein